MVEPTSSSHKITCIQINQPVQDAASYAEWSDPTLLSRKGRLFLICLPQIDGTFCAEVYRRYYTDTCFDVLPSLRTALRVAFASFPQARTGLLVALVVQDLDMLAVGTPAGAVWLVRSGQARELLTHRNEAATLEPDPSREAAEGEPRLCRVQQRLYVGDTVIVTVRQAVAPTNPREIQHAAHSPNPAAIAHAVAHMSPQRRDKQGPPVTVLHIPGFSPVPEMGPAKQWNVPLSALAKVRPAHEHSPVWAALAIATVIVGLSLWVSKPKLSRESLAGLLAWILTPTPAATGFSTLPARTPQTTPTMSALSTPSRIVNSPTAVVKSTPTTLEKARSTATEAVRAASPSPTAAFLAAQVYPLPELLLPYEGQDVVGMGVNLRWSWAGTLAEDEYFDVQLWHVGSPRKSIAWTQKREYTERYPDPGAYFWTVVVVRGKNGVVERELSPEPTPLRFSLRSGQPPVPNVTMPPMAPTRSTPTG
jgi:hypothetical protein